MDHISEVIAHSQNLRPQHASTISCIKCLEISGSSITSKKPKSVFIDVKTMHISLLFFFFQVMHSALQFTCPCSASMQEKNTATRHSASLPLESPSSHILY